MAAEGSTVKNNYDVFFNFCSQDFDNIDYLYTALIDAGYHIIKCDDMEGRSNVNSDVKRLISQSKISVVVLSKRYVSSECNLNQLIMITESNKNLILPLFYDMAPSEVSNQKGRFEGVFKGFKDKLKMETDPQTRINLTNHMNKWSEALSFAAYKCEFTLSSQAHGYESSLIKDIIKAVKDKLKDVVKDTSRSEGECSLHALTQERPLSLDQDWNGAEISLMDIEELPENPTCSFLVKLNLQHNNDLTEIPDSFFDKMPLLEVLDLSDTSIKKLPPSIARLEKLRQFFLRDCELLTELPTEIQGLGSLKVFDLEGTRLICLPKQMGMLLMLDCLKVSLFGNAKTHMKKTGIKAIIFRKREAVIPRNTLSKLYRLKVLCISVDTDSAWWDAEVEALIHELPQLTNLKTLELFFPSPAQMKKFSKLQMYWLLLNFTMIVGRHEQHIISSLPYDLRIAFMKLKKCLVYVNGKGNLNVLGDVIEDVRALFLDRHWTIKTLSEFKTEETAQLEFCMVVECNEMITLVEGYSHTRISQLQYLRYLSVHYMKNLQSIWRGPMFGRVLSRLEILALHTCPELTTILSPFLLFNLNFLKELTVVNCPKVESLVGGDISVLESDSYFLPALKKILLIDLPKLVSISSGFPIGPKIETILFSNCPELIKNLSQEEENMYGRNLRESKWLDKVGSCNNEITFLRKNCSLPTSHNDFTGQTESLRKAPSQDQTAVTTYTMWESVWGPIFQDIPDAWKMRELEKNRERSTSWNAKLYLLAAISLMTFLYCQILQKHLILRP